MADGRTKKLHADVVRSFEHTLAVLDPDGTRVADAAEAGRRAAESVVGTAELWQEDLGAFYDTRGVQQLLSREGKPVTRQAVSKRVSLLALKTGSGRVVYPAFQFRGGKPVAGLGELLRILTEDIVSPWTVASWLNAPTPDLGDESPIGLLEEGSTKPVLDAARHWAAALSA